MRGSDTLRLGQLFGIRIGVSRWWFLVLFFVIYALDRYFAGILPSSGEAFAIAVAGALLFFATVVAHELGHALVARHQGMAIEGIDLWALGGFTRTRGETASPGAEFRLAAAGPLVNAIVIVICIARGPRLRQPPALPRRRTAHLGPAPSQRGARAHRLARPDQRSAARLQPAPRLPARRRAHRARARRGA